MYTEFKNIKFDYIMLQEHPETDEFVLLLDNEIKSKGKTFLLIADTQELCDNLEKKGFNNFINTEKYIQSFDFKNIDYKKELIRLSELFDFSQFRQAIFPEHFWYTQPEKVFFKKLMVYLKFYEDVFLKNNISCKYFIQFVGDFIPYYARKIAAKKIADHFFYYGGFPVFERLNFTSDFKGRWIIENYEIEPTKKEIDYIESRIKKALDKRNYFFVNRLEDFVPKIKILDYIKSVPSVINRKIGKKDKYDHYTTGTYIKHKFVPVFNKHLTKKLYKEVNLKETKYMFFPLNFTYDSSLTSMAEPFVNQFYLIELIHRFLPFGYKLLVKEHPASIGTTSYKELKKISKLKDVVILPVYTNTYEIIENSKGIVVISSTVGLEALYMQKAILTFGETYYTKQGVTIDVRDLNELHNKIIELINFTPDKNEIIKMFTRVYRESYPINIQDIIMAKYENNIRELYKTHAIPLFNSFNDYIIKNNY